MQKRIFAAIAVAACLVSTNANAQLLGGLVGKALGMPALGEAAGAYQSNNQIRTYITTRPYSGIDLYAAVIVKAAELTKAKGFPIFGVTKSSCTTLLVNGARSADSCYVIAIMLNEGEKAKPRGKRTVRYYRVEDVQAGRIERP
jgi:hypothetical protein